MTTLQWKSPPTKRPGRKPSAVLDDVVGKLQRRPGQWALVVNAARSSNATAVFKRRGCQTRSVILEDGGFDIYAMYPEAK